ncbi:thiamine pyrophosphate-dependent dehydrogenase E1 component subunit alpha [Methylomicrobium sp. Wu6]|uniref:thiamine pyrophosphate-dependent dehydrogenase E1 component subunit alpha n=1 Tax=Methylomicrobium sp. Wu6 TaxID=3107928 RepID=UPI002DD650B2|nr:thiamine pyrophosphate-dependent dehydrogenase E1 component subunit alpha [Methylomicrobium sp. Wu6]MEC4746862.1 thiamine pyrophosphate-dependent dehydrogenase E1 component subunit alpha [Methylomicrobium sp. Wu6]
MDFIRTERDPLSLYQSMLLIRAYEKRLAALFAAGNFPLTCSAQGQEAAAVGVVRALNADDRILTNHRSSAHLLARGADPGRLIAEVMGKTTGYCGGKSGTLHISAKALGVVLTSTIVGGELSLATGVALSKQMLKQAGIVACFFGDGAACEGIFHESLNLASVWELPVLYVCENNQWQAFVHRRETMIADRIAPWAGNYAIDYASVDGNDVNAVLTAAEAAVERIRRTGKPYLLETCTYRQKGHFSLDDQGYVDADELTRWKALDPLRRMEAYLLESAGLSADDLAALRAQAEAGLDDAVAFAQQSPYPDSSALTADVYA